MVNEYDCAHAYHDSTTRTSDRGQDGLAVIGVLAGVAAVLGVVTSILHDAYFSRQNFVFHSQLQVEPRRYLLNIC